MSEKKKFDVKRRAQLKVGERKRKSFLVNNLTLDGRTDTRLNDISPLNQQTRKKRKDQLFSKISSTCWLEENDFCQKNVFISSNLALSKSKVIKSNAVYILPHQQ